MKLYCPGFSGVRMGSGDSDGVAQKAHTFMPHISKLLYIYLTPLKKTRFQADNPEP